MDDAVRVLHGGNGDILAADYQRISGLQPGDVHRIKQFLFPHGHMQDENALVVELDVIVGEGYMEYAVLQIYGVES